MSVMLRMQPGQPHHRRDPRLTRRCRTTRAERERGLSSCWTCVSHDTRQKAYCTCQHSSRMRPALTAPSYRSQGTRDLRFHSCRRHSGRHMGVQARLCQMSLTPTKDQRRVCPTQTRGGCVRRPNQLGQETRRPRSGDRNCRWLILYIRKAARNKVDVQGEEWSGVAPSQDGRVSESGESVVAEKQELRRGHGPGADVGV